MSDDTYICTVSYETFRQGMTPKEAAELAVSVLVSGTDPAAAPGHVLVTVQDEDDYEIPVGYQATEPGVEAQPQLLTVEECAQLVGVTPSTWRAYVARQQAPEPTARYARTPLWERSVVAAWHAGRRSQQSTQPQETAGDGNVANMK